MHDDSDKKAHHGDGDTHDGDETNGQGVVSLETIHYGALMVCC